MRHKILIILALVIIITAVAIGFFLYLKSQKTAPAPVAASTETKNIYLAFTDEIYDKIKEHYWNKITDEQLSKLYKLAAEKISGSPQDLFFQDQTGVNGMINKILSAKDEAGKKSFTVDLATIVLANLEPFGRGGLFGEKQAEELKNNVQNIDPNTDLYQALGASKDDAAEQIQKKYEVKVKELNNIITDNSKSTEEKTEAQNKLALADRARETLGNSADRDLYNQAGIESTVATRLISPTIYYLRLKKMSPTSFDEFQKAVNEADQNHQKLNTLILDLRGNIGGSIDLMQWFLGPFIGPNNLAYEFYHQDVYEPFKTKVGWLPSLVRYKKVVVLIDGTVQSSAEVMSATFKKYHVAVLVGMKTKGWGTIEKIFPLDNQIDPEQKYSMFLVHSITMTENNEPIEGRGVEPHVNIENADWPKQFLEYYNYPEIVSAVKQIWPK